MKIFGWEISVSVERVPHEELPTDAAEALEHTAQSIVDDIIEALDEERPCHGFSLYREKYGVTCRAVTRGKIGQFEVTSKSAHLLMRIRELLDSRGHHNLVVREASGDNLVLSTSK